MAVILHFHQSDRKAVGSLIGGGIDALFGAGAHLRAQRNAAARRL